jgi:hypothetical protein
VKNASCTRSLYNLSLINLDYARESLSFDLSQPIEGHRLFLIEDELVYTFIDLKDLLEGFFLAFMLLSLLIIPSID